MRVLFLLFLEKVIIADVSLDGLVSQIQGGQSGQTGELVVDWKVLFLISLVFVNSLLQALRKRREPAASFVRKASLHN